MQGEVNDAGVSTPCVVIVREKATRGAPLKWTVLLDEVPVGLLPNDGVLACPIGKGVHKLGISLEGGRPPPIEIDVPAALHLKVRIAVPFKVGAVVPQFPEGIVVLKKVEITQSELDGLHATMIETVNGSPKRLTLPSHAGRVLAAGIGAWLIGILGFYAFGRGMQDLQQMKSGEMSSDGKPAIIFGMISGVLGFLVNAGVLISRCSSGNF